MNIKMRALEARDIPPIVTLMHHMGWFGKTTSLYERYLDEQANGARVVILGFSDETFVGYVTIIWHPSYPPFVEQSIPEISDITVMPAHRRHGIGSVLMDEAERRIFERSNIAGIGFGISADYGAAQRMFIKRGYIPDGRGLWSSKGHYVWELTTVPVDDCAIFLTKSRGT